MNEAQSNKQITNVQSFLEKRFNNNNKKMASAYCRIINMSK